MRSNADWFLSPNRLSRGLAAAAALAACALQAEPQLAPLFGDHLVLQCDKPDPVWGSASPGETVSVTFHGATQTTKAGADGRWLVNIGPFKATGDSADLVVAGSSSVTLHDVVVGEVWICSGQSNMEFVVDAGNDGYRVNNFAAEVAAAKFPLIRQLAVERAVASEPQRAFKTNGWVPASPATVGSFTAVGYFFARDIHKTLGVPVGIILSSWGGTPVEAWMSDQARASTSLGATVDDRWKKALAEWPPERVAKHPEVMAAWVKASEEAKAKHVDFNVPWPGYPASDTSPNRPGGLFNGMLAPLEPAAIRGFLWYQGESNVGHATEYAELFGSMIKSWRSGFGQGDLPFYFVQLANFGNEYEFKDRGWALLREAQAQTLALPATGMAVTADIGIADNIHPRNKQEVGRRLALIARANVYGVPPDFTGPVFSSAAVDGKAIRVHFAHCVELAVHGDRVTSLEVAGADKVFYPAAGVVEADTLKVSSPDVPEPVAVRYAWTNAPLANLYGDNGLPVVPFRTDTW